MLGDLLAAPAPNNADRVKALAGGINSLGARSSSRGGIGEVVPNLDLGARLGSVLDIAAVGAEIPDELADEAMVTELEDLVAALIELRRF